MKIDGFLCYFDPCVGINDVVHAIPVIKSWVKFGVSWQLAGWSKQSLVLWCGVFTVTTMPTGHNHVYHPLSAWLLLQPPIDRWWGRVNEYKTQPRADPLDSCGEGVVGMKKFLYGWRLKATVSQIWSNKGVSDPAQNPKCPLNFWRLWIHFCVLLLGEGVGGIFLSFFPEII